MATAAFDTVSPQLSLGLQNPDHAFVDGDVLSLSLAVPSPFLGLYIDTSDPAAAGELALATPVGAVRNETAPVATLPDGGLVYFLGLASDTPFQEAVVGFASDGEAHFVYTVDDVLYLPEAGWLAGMAWGVALVAGLRRRRGARRGRRER